MPADTGSDIGHILQDIVSYNAGPGWIGSHLNGVDPPDEIQPKERQIFRCFRQGIPEDTPVMVRGWGEPSTTGVTGRGHSGRRSSGPNISKR